MYAIFILCFVFHSVFQIVWINYTFYCQKTKDQGDSIYLTPPCTLSYLHLHTCKYFLTHTSHTHNPHTRAHTYIICKYKQIQFLANLSVHRDNEVLNIKQQQEQQQCRRPSAPTERAESERAESECALPLSENGKERNTIQTTCRTVVKQEQQYMRSPTERDRATVSDIVKHLFCLFGISGKGTLNLIGQRAPYIFMFFFLHFALGGAFVCISTMKWLSKNNN